MMGRKTNSAVEARKLARERRMKLDADRAERDERIEAAAAAVFVAQADRDDALAAVAAADAAIAGSVRALIDDEGLTQQQTGDLLGLDAPEVRRLAKLGTETTPKAAPGKSPATTTAAAADEQVVRS